MSEAKDYRDNMLIDDIASNDMEMLRDAIKNASKHHFGRDMNKAVRFVQDCVARTFRRLGMTNPQPPPNCNSQMARARFAAKLDMEMREKGVKIERRNHYTGNDQWRCGIYIYQRGELVAFISDIFTERRTEFDRENLKVTGGSIGYMVITNARADDTQRVFVVPEMPASLKALPGDKIN